MIRHLLNSAVTLTLIAGLFAPYATILLAPKEAFAATEVPVKPGSSLGNTAAQQGGTVSWSQAAAGGAVGIGQCLAAGGLSIGGGLSALGNLFGLGGGGSTQTGTGGAPVVEPIGGLGGVISGGVSGVNPVPVKDSALIAIQKQSLVLQGAQLVTIEAMHNKEAVLDCIAWALAKLIWQAVAASVIDWINSGFNGRPAFVQDLGRFLTGVADQTIGNIIQGSDLAFLCSPFQLQVRIALASAYSRKAPSCTLTQVIGNVQNFLNNFTQGGWPAWLEMTTIPQNNPFGGYLLGAAKIDIAINNKVLLAGKELDFGNGFLSQKKTVGCDTAQGCRDIIVTPGQLIAGQAQETIGGGQTQLLLADELDEIVSAVVSQLLSVALGSFFGLSQPTGYQDDYYRSNVFTDDLRGASSTPTGGIDGSSDVINLIDQGIQDEQTFQNLNSQAISIIESAQRNVDTLVACWNNKASATSTTGAADPGDRAQAHIEAGTASLTNTALNQKKQPYINAITRSIANVSTLEGLIQDAIEATTQAGLDTVLRDYYSARSDSSFASQGGIIVLEASLSQIQNDMNSMDTLTQSNIERCTYFPFPPPSSPLFDGTTL